MGANFSTAVYQLVCSLLNLYMSAVVLRVILAWVRADFYNPVSQLVWKITQPIVGPMVRVVPRWRRLDTAALVFLVVLACLYVNIVPWLISRPVPTFWPVQAILKILVLAGNLYTVSMTFQAILSWFGPGVNNPASNILWSMNEPILRPIRRLIPPVAGLDLSPLLAIVAMQFMVMLVRLDIMYRAGILG
jgi:YggT family protein